MSRFEMLCSSCMIPVAPVSGGPPGLLACPRCNSEVQVPVMVAEDGETLVSVTDQLAIAEQEIDELRRELVESKRVLEQINLRDDDRGSLVARMQLRINELNVERAELRGQLEQLRRQNTGSNPIAGESQAKRDKKPASTLRVQQIESELAASKETVARLEAAQEGGLEKLSEMERELASSRATLVEKDASLTRLEADLADAVEDAARLREENTAFRRESLELRSQVDAMILERDNLKRSLEASGSSAPSHESEELRAALAEIRVELLNAKEAAANRESELIELKAKLERAEREAGSARTRLEETEKQHDRSVEELIDVKRNYAMLNNRCQGLQAEVKRLEAECAAYSTQAARTSTLSPPAEAQAPGLPQDSPQTSDPAPESTGEKSGLMKVFGVLKRSK